MPNSSYTRAWLLWGGSFLAIEGAALIRDHRHGTLSAHIWRWFHVQDNQTNPLVRFALRVGLASFMAWLFLHLNFGILNFI